MSDTPALRPCPFCGRPPIINLGKKGNCQLHGDPFQPVVIRCNTSDCTARPSVEAGDVFNGGEQQARAKAIAAWNRRDPAAIVPDANDEAMVKIVAQALWSARSSHPKMAVMTWEELLEAVEANPSSWNEEYLRLFRQARAVLTALAALGRGA